MNHKTSIRTILAPNIRAIVFELAVMAAIAFGNGLLLWVVLEVLLD